MNDEQSSYKPEEWSINFDIMSISLCHNLIESLKSVDILIWKQDIFNGPLKYDWLFGSMHLPMP